MRIVLYLSHVFIRSEQKENLQLKIVWDCFVKGASAFFSLVEAIHAENCYYLFLHEFEFT